jgi:cell division protease FtsH
VSYTFFLTQVDARNVQDVMSTGDTIEGDFKKNVPYDAQGASATTVVQVDRFTTQRPSFADDNLFQKLQTTGVQVNANNPDQAAPLWQQILVGFGPTLFLVGLLVWLGRRAAAGGGLGGVGGIGRARAQRYEPDVVPRTTFADVAGIDEVENEVSEIVDFLRDPDRYRRLGAQIPSGGAEFIEMIVGVGASRVRDLFDQAKKVAPAIIFIDELDAIGRACGGSAAIGGHDEREQTLNQILTEMDGFTGNEGVVVLAATNRRRRDHRRGERPGSGQQHRSADGRPVGNVRGHRPMTVLPRRARKPHSASTVSPQPPGNSSTVRPAASSTNVTTVTPARLSGL